MSSFFFLYPWNLQGKCSRFLFANLREFPKTDSVCVTSLFLVSFHSFCDFTFQTASCLFGEWNRLRMNKHRWLDAYPAALSFIGCFWPDTYVVFPRHSGCSGTFGGKWCVWLRGKLNCIFSVLVQRDKKDEVTHESQVKPSLAGCIISTIEW